MGNNNLYKIENTLRSIAKRYKSVKYSLGLAILFLMMGVSAFSEEAVAQQEVMTNEQIAESKENLKDSIGNLQSKIDSAKKENEKGLTGLRLELIQLMEQGNQVVKSPWSSWQFGANYIYSKWNGTYKGRGDKSEKYPYNGIFVRETGANEFNRYVSEESSMYSYLSKSNNATSASSSLRGKTNDYGLASNTTVPEKPVSFEISASIKPRIVTKGAITVPAPAALSPTLPKAIDFKPVTPKISTFTPNTITLDPINMPGTANGDEQYIYGNTTASNNTSSGSDDVAPISQQSITGGTMNITTNAGRTNIFSTGTSFVGVSGGATTQAARETNNGAKNLDIENNDSYAAMKNIGGQKITMNNVTFNYSGTGPTGANAYRRWLFHTDGHGDYGDTTWVLNGTNVNMNGKNLVMYYSQYHGNSSMHGNIGFVNNG